MKEIKRFGDLDFGYDDVEEWYKINQLLNNEIIVIDYIITNGEFGEYAIVKFQFVGSEKICAFTTGGKVILKKLDKAKDMNLLPLIGRIVKKKNYYDIV